MKKTLVLALSLTASAAVLPSAVANDEAWDHPYEYDSLRVPKLKTGGSCLITGVTVHSAVEPARVADVLVRDGDIAAIGTGLEAPDGVMVIDGTGKHLAPGVVDTHSHMAIERGINESTLSITAECDISDVINVDDTQLYRALAGGVTTIQCLHGSANAIGGRSEVLKMRWGSRVADMRFPDAPQGIKFALGENPKRSPNRYPSTRPGVESVFQRAFMRTREYAAEWEAYEKARSAGADPAPPRRDVRLDVLRGILDGTIEVHSHCYRADEIVMLLRVAEEFGFKITTLQHVLEGYKVAQEIVEHGAGPSSFSDWWGYKIEAYDAIPQNAAMLDEAGAVSTINSDSGEVVRRLYDEAAKSVRYADMDPVAALRLVTLNGAIQLGIDERVGSIELGKDADLVLLNGDPLSIYARVEWTMVDGEIEFQRRDAFELDSKPAHPLAFPPAGAIEASFNPSGGELLAITGATVHPVTAPPFENGTILVQDGHIVEMGIGFAIPASAKVIDASGLHAWPGMIAIDTSIGLREIGSVPGTIDTSEIGGNQPDLRIASSVNAASSHVGITRSNGVTRAQTTPQGSGPISGQSAILRLEGDTWEEMLMVDRDMLQIRFPRSSNSDEKKEEPEAVEELRKLFDEAREYARLVADAERAGVSKPAYDPRLQALAPYANGERRIAIHATNAQTILFALKFIEEEELDAFLIGATEGWKVVDAIKESGVTVVTGPVLTTPSSRYDPYDAPFANAAVLHRAGVPIAITDQDNSNTRNLPFHAGTAAAYGLPREEALRAVTYYPAKVLGIEDQLGSLERGKIADIVLTDGDLLESTTRVTHLMIDGELQDIGNRQTRLYERYRERMLDWKANR